MLESLNSFTLPSGPFTSLGLAGTLGTETRAYGLVNLNGVLYGGTGNVSGHLFSINTTTNAVADLGVKVPNRLNPPNTPMRQNTNYCRPLLAPSGTELWYAISPIWNKQARILSIFPGQASSPTNPADLGEIRIDSNYVTAAASAGGRLYFGVKFREGNPHMMSRQISLEDLTAPHPPSNLATAPVNNSLNISWNNPGATDLAPNGQTMVRWSTSGYPTSITDGALLITKPATVAYSADSTLHNGLNLGTTYYYSLFTRDNAGNWSVGAHVNGTPRISPVTNFTASPGFQTVTLNWSNPSTTSFKGTVIYVRTDHFPSFVGDGTQVVNKANTPGSNDSYVHSNLSNGITYYYAAFAYDNQPSYATPAVVSALPVTPSPTNLLQNPDVETFTNGVATGWQKYNNLSVAPPSGYVAQSFFQDNGAGTVHHGSWSQKINGICTAAIPNNGVDYYVNAGIYQSVASTPGKIYLMVGWQNLDSSGFSGTGYYQEFGISPTGSTNPGTPGFGTNVSDAVWLRPGESLFNNDNGGAAFVPGYKKLFSATPATGSVITCWTGLGVRAKGNRTNCANQMNVDDNYLYAIDAPVVDSLLNSNMEGDIVTIPESGIFLPAGWQPIGGGIGQTCSYGVSNDLSLVHGARSATISTSKGKINAGLLQRISTISGQSLTFSAQARGASASASNDPLAVVFVGIDPTGGTNILSNSIIWSPSSNIGGIAGWRSLTVTTPATGPVATLFMRVFSNSGDTVTNYAAMFDDAAFSATPAPTATPNFTSTANGTVLTMRNQVVTGAFPGFFYIESPDRIHGIKVVSGTSVAAGNAVDIYGTLATVNGERQITASSVYVQSAVNLIPEPWGMSDRLVGGKTSGNNPGIAGSTAPYNVGLRVKVWGKASGVGGGTFTLTDGSAPIQSYKVSYTGLTAPAEGANVVVTGISSVDVSSGPSKQLVRATAITTY